MSLARLLLTDRPIWLLDEPTVSLDKRSMQQFSKILKNHLEAGGAAVVATHIDLGLTLSSLSTNLEDYQMKNGKTEFWFDPHQMLIIKLLWLQ